MAKFTTEQFIEKAKSVHGDRYTYEHSEYIGNREKVTITCPTHGDFSISAEHFLYRKAGCPICAKEKSRQQLKKIQEEKEKRAQLEEEERAEKEARKSQIKKIQDSMARKPVQPAKEYGYSKNLFW